MKISLCILQIVLIGGCLCASCSSTQTAPAVSTSAPASNPPGYPVQGGASNFGYPPPNFQVATLAPVTPIAPVEPPEPALGKASISGLLYALNTMQVISRTTFYLYRVNGDEPLPVIVGDPNRQRGDIVGISDDNGQFSLNAIPAGSYYLLVWAPYNWIAWTGSVGSKQPQLIRLGSDQAMPLGVVYLSWP